MYHVLHLFKVDLRFGSMNFLMANYLPDSALCPFSRALNMYMLMHDSGKGIIYGTLCIQYKLIEKLTFELSDFAHLFHESKHVFF